MKTQKFRESSKYSRWTVRSAGVFLFTLSLLLISIPDSEAQEDISGTYKLMLVGHKAVPNVQTNATGIVTVKIQDDTLMVKGKFSDLSSEHHRSFIGVGEKGKTGNVLFTLNPEFLNEEYTEGKFSYSDNKFEISNIHKQLIRDNQFYVAVASSSNKMGEVRAQLNVDE